MNDTVKQTKKGKFQMAVEIVGTLPDANRDQIVTAIQEALDTNKKNASTYYGRYLKEIKPLEDAASDTPVEAAQAFVASND